MEAKWFSGRLRELREAAGLTRKELAAMAGFRSEGGIRDIELGITLPGWEVVVALCQALKVEPGAFLIEPGPQPERKRGRPPKPVADVALATTKRPVGRPRKTPAEPPPPKRPRGRPKKV